MLNSVPVDKKQAFLANKLVNFNPLSKVNYHPFADINLCAKSLLLRH